MYKTTIFYTEKIPGENPANTPSIATDDRIIFPNLVYCECGECGEGEGGERVIHTK